jgi:hypothetical protein
LTPTDRRGLSSNGTENLHKLYPTPSSSLGGVSIRAACALIFTTRCIWAELASLMEVYVQRRGMFQLLAGAAIGGGNALFASPSNGKDQASQNHVAWVTEVLKRMQTILPGMTREALYQGPLRIRTIKHVSGTAC